MSLSVISKTLIRASVKRFILKIVFFMYIISLHRDIAGIGPEQVIDVYVTLSTYVLYIEYEWIQWL